ncbi:MAG: PilZ domain-containing protein [Gammaproteobacteria bacterium]
MTLGNRSYEEKRSFIRMKIDAMVSFSIEGKNERYEGRCKNISGAGLLLETPKKIPLGTRINVIIPSENSTIDNLSATVDITRVTPQPDQHSYELAGVITQIKP